MDFQFQYQYVLRTTNQRVNPNLYTAHTPGGGGHPDAEAPAGQPLTTLTPNLHQHGSTRAEHTAHGARSTHARYTPPLQSECQ